MTDNVIHKEREFEERARVARISDEWVKTPYHHMNRVKGFLGGVDCGQLLIGVFSEASLIEPFDTGYYPHDWHMHRDEERYLEFVEGCGGKRVDHSSLSLKQRRELDKDFHVSTGDILVWKVGRCFSHGAIVVRWPEIVHAYFPSRMVERVSVINTPMAERPMRVYSYWGPR